MKVTELITTLDAMNLEFTVYSSERKIVCNGVVFYADGDYITKVTYLNTHVYLKNNDWTNMVVDPCGRVSIAVYEDGDCEVVKIIIQDPEF